MLVVFKFVLFCFVIAIIVVSFKRYAKYVVVVVDGSFVIVGNTATINFVSFTLITVVAVVKMVATTYGSLR